MPVYDLSSIISEMMVWTIEDAVKAVWVTAPHLVGIELSASNHLAVLNLSLLKRLFQMYTIKH